MTLHAQLQGVFLGRPCRVLAPPRMQARRLHRQVVSMSAVAAPAELTVKSFDGESAGTEQLALKVANRSTANGLVHRYLITVRQNNRAVRCTHYAPPNQRIRPSPPRCTPYPASLPSHCLSAAPALPRPCGPHVDRAQPARRREQRSGAVAGSPMLRRARATPGWAASGRRCGPAEASPSVQKCA